MSSDLLSELLAALERAYLGGYMPESMLGSYVRFCNADSNPGARSAVPSSHVSGTDQPLKSKDHVSEQPSVDRCVWRPMDTAPRDRTFILAYWPRHPYDEDDDLDESVDLGGVLAVTCSNGDGWIEPDYLDAIGRSFDDDDAYAPEPTLWTPLPPSPPAAVHHEAPEPKFF